MLRPSRWLTGRASVSPGVLPTLEGCDEAQRGYCPCCGANCKAIRTVRKTWHIGFIAHRYETFYDPLFSGLKELGYVEGQNLIVERRYAEGNADRFKEFAAEMARLKVDAVIVVTTPAAMAAKNETQTIPIIHPAAIDPVGTGLIASLARPGGNVTALPCLMQRRARNV